MTDNKLLTTPAVMTATSASAQASPKKTANQAAKSKKPRAKPTHPRTAEMVNAAIKALKERGGSSLQAIKKYITGTYKIDAEKQAPFIKKYLKAAVASGNLVQTKGKGAAGSFKLSVGKTEISKKKPLTRSAPLKKVPAVVKKPVTKKPVKKAPIKKSPVKPAAPEKRKAAKGPAAKPPKAKSAAKVKAVPKPTPKKAPAVKKTPTKAKAKKPAKKVVAKKK